MCAITKFMKYGSYYRKGSNMDKTTEDQINQKVEDQDLIIGKWFKHQRINRWKELGFPEEMSFQAWGVFFGFTKISATQKISELEKGRLPHRKVLEKMCIMLGAHPGDMYDRGPYDAYVAEEEEKLEILKGIKERNAATLPGLQQHMRDLYGAVSTNTKAELVKSV